MSKAAASANVKTTDKTDKNPKAEAPTPDPKSKGNAANPKAADKPDKNDKADKVDKNDKAEKHDKNDKTDKGDKADKIDKTAKPDKPTKPEKSGKGDGGTFLTESKALGELSKEKPDNVLSSSGLMDAYDYLQKQICKHGFPKGNVYEYAAITILKYERKLKAKEADKKLEVINKEKDKKPAEGKEVDASRQGRSPRDHPEEFSKNASMIKSPNPKDDHKGKTPIKEEEVKVKGKGDKSPDPKDKAAAVKEEEVKVKGKGDKSPDPKDKGGKGGKEEDSKKDNKAVGKSPDPKAGAANQKDSVIDDKAGKKEADQAAKGKKK